MFTYTHTQYTRAFFQTINLQSAGCGQARECQAKGGTPRRNASLAFRLERLQKFRYGVPPFQKVPVGLWLSGAFRLSLSTGVE